MRSPRSIAPNNWASAAPKYAVGRMTPLAASSAAPDTSPLRADSALSVMFGWEKPPLLSAGNDSAGPGAGHDREHARVRIQAALQVTGGTG